MKRSGDPEMPVVGYWAEKWGGRPHYRGDVVVLGEDEFGVWIWGAKGRRITRGGDEADFFLTEQDALALVPRDAWWNPSWWVGHPELEVYVNINTPAVWTDKTCTYVDLDLDVARWLDGRVEILDEDEFAEHQVAYDYPAHIVEGARRATEEARQLAEARMPPFDGLAPDSAAVAWIEAARALGL